MEPASRFYGYLAGLRIEDDANPENDGGPVFIATFDNSGHLESWIVPDLDLFRKLLLKLGASAANWLEYGENCQKFVIGRGKNGKWSIELP